MIPQIIQQKTRSARLYVKKVQGAHRQAVKRLSFSVLEKRGVGDVAVNIGKNVRKSYFVEGFLRMVGIVKVEAMPWELRYTGRAKKTWGALTRAGMHKQKMVYVGDNAKKRVTDIQSSNPFFDSAQSATEVITQAKRSQKKRKKGVVAKMHAKRNVQAHAFEAQIHAKHQVIDIRKKKVGGDDMQSEIITIPETLRFPATDVQVIGQSADLITEKEEYKEKNNTLWSRFHNRLSFAYAKDGRSDHRRKKSKEGKHVWVRGGLSRAVGAQGTAFLLLLALFSSLKIVIPYINAEVSVQNYTQETAAVVEGITLLSYEERDEDEITTKAEFDSGTYTDDQFEVGVDDLEALAIGGLTVGHYGDNPPDISDKDWWDDDADTATLHNWRYRRCFVIDNSASADDMIEYQIYLDMDTETLIDDGEMQITGADIRFLSENDDVLPHFIADDINTIGTKIWVQIDEILAGEEEEVCMYYGNASAVSTSTREDVFTYTAPREIYHVVADTAVGNVTDFASYSDDNEITVAAYTGTLDETEADAYPVGGVGTLTETSSISVTHPINASYQSNGADNVAPVSAAGTEFVYRTDRYTNEFSIIAPWCSASLTFENGDGNNILDTATATSSPFAIAQGSSRTIRTNDTAANGIATNQVVIIEEDGADCPVLIAHHGNTGGDSYTMFPASLEWYGVGSGSFHVGVLEDTTSVTVYKSDGTSVGPTVYDRGEGFTINDAGSQGSEVAHRVVADKPIGAQARGDGDGGDAVTFLPVDELGYRHYIADVSQYIAIATSAGVTTTVDLYHDGTACGTGTPDDTATVAAVGNAPGKVYFGLTAAGDHIPAGACIVADQPIYAYNEYSGSGDEHNLWSEKQNRQFISPAPTYSVGAEEVGLWSIDGTNEWVRRVPVTINNAATTAIDEYQIQIDLGTDVQTLFGETQIDGGDIRVAGGVGDGTDNIDYFLASFDDGTNEGMLWTQTPVVAASSTATLYIYYGPIGVDIATDYTPLLWLDAADDSTITETAGELNVVSDKSGSGNDFAAPAGQEPTVGVDGIKQVFTFDGAIDEIQDADGVYENGTTYTDFTNFIVYKDLTLGVTDAVFAFDALGTQVSSFLAPWGATLSYWRPSTIWTAYTYGGDTTDYHVIRLENDTTGTNQKSVYRDDVLVGQTLGGGQAVTGDGSTSIIGDWVTGNIYNKHMQFAEMITIPATVSGTDKDIIEQYLTEKWITRPSTTLTTTGSYNSIWQTSTPKPNYYVVDERGAAVGEADVISFDDANTITVAGSSVVADEGEVVVIPPGSGITQQDAYAVTGPLAIGFDGDTTDSAIPIGYAGTEFLAGVARSADSFSFYAPYADASVQIQGATAAGYVTQQTVNVPEGVAITVAEDIIDGRAFKIIADEPILAFHRNATNDSKVLYPAEEAYVESSGQYEVYGVGTGSVLIAASVATDVEIYRSNGTNTTVTLDASNLFYEIEAGIGAQGTAYGYRIVSDDPIGASSYADSDGGETVSFVGQKEFSDEYIVPNPAQYMSIVTRDAGTECRVYDETGAAVTTGPVEMDNVPPQTAGAEVLPYPNRIHIGGDDITDGAFFEAGYRLECDDPVYAYYEHHLDATVSDETSWLTWPQARTRNYIEPTVEDLDDTDEEGLYYESGFDSAGAGSDPEATAEYIFDVSAETYGEHTYWRDITWEEVITDRGALNGVQQVKIESAYADGPSCTSATYSTFTEAIGTITLATSTDTSETFYDSTKSAKKAFIGEQANDHDCLKVRVTLATGDPVLAPVVPGFTLGYYVPDILEGQLSTPQVDIADTVGATDERFRIVKAITADTNLTGSEAHLTYENVSDPADFTTANLDFRELLSDTTNAQFTFPAFPAGELTASTSSPLDIANDLAIYYTGQRTAGANEQINIRLNVDILGAGGPAITRNITLEIEG